MVVPVAGDEGGGDNDLQVHLEKGDCRVEEEGVGGLGSDTDTVQ